MHRQSVTRLCAIDEEGAGKRVIAGREPGPLRVPPVRVHSLGEDGVARGDGER